MNVKDLRDLSKGEFVSVLKGEGALLIDFEAGKIVAFSTLNEDGSLMNKKDGFLLDLHDTVEEAIEQIKEFNER